jgi:hypothetical protein
MRLQYQPISGGESAFIGAVHATAAPFSAHENGAALRGERRCFSNGIMGFVSLREKMKGTNHNFLNRPPRAPFKG